MCSLWYITITAFCDNRRSLFWGRRRRTRERRTYVGAARAGALCPHPAFRSIDPASGRQEGSIANPREIRRATGSNPSPWHVNAAIICTQIKKTKRSFGFGTAATAAESSLRRSAGFSARQANTAAGHRVRRRAVTIYY